MSLPATPWDALKALANELEHHKDTIVHQRCTFNPTNGMWETPDTMLDAWKNDREELIEHIRDKALEYYVEE